MLLMTMTLPYLLLKAFCDKVLSVGDMFVCGFLLPTIFTKMCATLIEADGFSDLVIFLM